MDVPRKTGPEVEKDDWKIGHDVEKEVNDNGELEVVRAVLLVVALELEVVFLHSLAL